MIKIGIRKNLIYPTVFAFSSALRDIEYIFMKKYNFIKKYISENNPIYFENLFLTLICLYLNLYQV